jgi:hypothetical protein
VKTIRFKAIAKIQAREIRDGTKLVRRERKVSRNIWELNFL